MKVAPCNSRCSDTVAARAGLNALETAVREGREELPSNALLKKAKDVVAEGKGEVTRNVTGSFHSGDQYWHLSPILGCGRTDSSDPQSDACPNVAVSSELQPAEAAMVQVETCLKWKLAVD